MRTALSIFLAILLVGIVAQCIQRVEPTPEPKITPVTGPIKAPWEDKWEETLAAAKKEGEVLVYGNVVPKTREALTLGFEKKFGIPLDILVLTGSELSSKMNAEYRAGIYRPDALLGGVSTFVNQMKPDGNLTPMEPLLILPEVKDPKAWADGKVPFVDRDTQALGFVRRSQARIVRNADLVNEGEINSYRDLLNPKWKGTIVMFDPGITGSAASCFTDLVSLWGYDEAMGYLRALGKQDVVITRDYRLQVEWVARAKYSIALWPRSESVVEFLDVNAPLALVKLREPVRITSGASGIAMPRKPAHPNGGIVFLNWLLSREGQTISSISMNLPSSRVDIPIPKSIRPEMLIQPGEEAIPEDEETILMRVKVTAAAAEIVSSMK